MYREVQKPPNEGTMASSSCASASVSKEAGEKPHEESVDDSAGVMMGVLAVPSWMTPSDFLAFVAPAAEGMTHLRIIRYASSVFFSVLARLNSYSTQRLRTEPVHCSHTIQGCIGSRRIC